MSLLYFKLLPVSVALFALLSTAVALAYEFLGDPYCGPEGCYAYAGFPIPFLRPDMTGSSSISYPILLLDMALVHISVELVHRALKWLRRHPK